MPQLTQTILESLNHNKQINNHHLRCKSKAERSRQESILRYEQLMKMSWYEKKQFVSRDLVNRNWGYRNYTNRSSFTKQENMQQYPNNNTKYNVQFLQRSVKGSKNYKFQCPQNQKGLFRNIEKNNYNNHYKPILEKKLKQNQNYILRSSLYGPIEIDKKRDRIMNNYHIQSNPFKNGSLNNQLNQTYHIYPYSYRDVSKYTKIENSQ